MATTFIDAFFAERGNKITKLAKKLARMGTRPSANELKEKLKSQLLMGTDSLKELGKTVSLAAFELHFKSSRDDEYEDKLPPGSVCHSCHIHYVYFDDYVYETYLHGKEGKATFFERYIKQICTKAIKLMYEAHTANNQ